MASEDKKVKITKDGYDYLLNSVFLNIKEERDLALDRYRTQDQQMTSPEDFVLQGKDVVSFLKLASDRTNALLAIAKEVKEIAYANELNAKSVSINSTTTSDEERKEMEKFIKETKANKKQLKDIEEDDITQDKE